MSANKSLASSVQVCHDVGMETEAQRQARLAEYKRAMAEITAEYRERMSRAHFSHQSFTWED